jgi:peptidyl-prolyl cis-trans isomerase B (cyclophilin B)
MARSRDPNSAGSQFFICVDDVFRLDHRYTVFGQVIDGMEVVDQIVSVPRDENDNPLEKIEMTVRIVPRSQALRE